MGDEQTVRRLYEELLTSWNERDAGRMAACFDEDGYVVGFDGSSHCGPAGIRSDLGTIFEHHQTPTYVGIIRNIRFVSPDLAILRATAGMVPPGQRDIKGELNAVQSLVVLKTGGHWRIALFQNTPAAFHGRPELGTQLTEELRTALAAQRNSESPR